MPFQYKSSRDSDSGKMVPWGDKPTVFCLLAFSVKPLFSAPPARLYIISLSCSKQSEPGLLTVGHGTSPPSSPQAG